MKKKFIFLIIFLGISFNVSAITLGEYERKLQAYKDDIAAKNRAIKKTEQEIYTAEKNISNIKTNIQNGIQTIRNLNAEIEKNNEEIVKRKGEINRTIAYYQISESYNPELDYIFQAETTTDLIYRYAVINQILEHNKNTIEKLKNINISNKEKEKLIEAEEKKLETSKSNLEVKVVELGQEKASIQDAAMSVQQQVKSYDELVKYYKKQGCKSSDVIGRDCAVNSSAGAFKRPTTSGYVTSEFGSRWGTFHQGIDIGNRQNPTIAIYSIANGRVTTVYKDVYGALCVGAEYLHKGTYYTALYCHLSRFGNVWVGKNISVNDIVGYMGNTGWSYGNHLHLEVSPCRYLNWGDSNCNTWSKYASFVRRKANSGYKGPRAVIDFPKLNQWWYAR